MPSRLSLRPLRLLLRSSPRSASFKTTAASPFFQTQAASRQNVTSSPRAAFRASVCSGFHTSSILRKGIQPETSDPEPSDPAPSTEGTQAVNPADISVDEYHSLADIYIDHLVQELEGLQEGREDIDVEYSVCHYPESLPLTSLAVISYIKEAFIR